MVRPHNLPLIPGLLRAAAGAALAAPLHATEPLWSLAPVWQWAGEGFYDEKRKVGRGVCVSGGGAGRGGAGEGFYGEKVGWGRCGGGGGGGAGQVGRECRRGLARVCYAAAGWAPGARSQWWRQGGG